MIPFTFPVSPLLPQKKGCEFNKNTTLHIYCNYETGFALKIKKDWTKYPKENEMLLSCYNVYQRMGAITRDVDEGKRIIHLKLLNYHDLDQETVVVKYVRIITLTNVTKL